VPLEFTAEALGRAERRRGMELSNQEINDRTGQIIDAAIKVHTLLGPGLLESTYEACLAHELKLRGLAITTQYPIDLVYEGLRLEVGYRADLLVENAVIVELKAVDKILSVHEAQLISYLRLTGFKVGLLINFHEERLKDGIRRRVNRF
jgi:GxxExxY protein